MMLNKKWIPIVMISCFLFIFLTGCAPIQKIETKNTNTSEKSDANETAYATRKFKHYKGETEVPANPKRVILLGRYLDQMIALGVQPMAAPNWEKWIGDVFPKHLQDKIVGEIMPIEDESKPNYESLLALDPDLIIGSQWMARNYEELSKIAPTVLIDESKPLFPHTLLQLGELFNKKERAEQIIQEYNKKANEAKQKLADAVGNETFIFVRLSGDKLYTIYGPRGDQTGRLLYTDLGLKMLDGVPNFDPSGQAELSLEGFLQLNPDHIFIFTDIVDDANNQLKELEYSNVWKSLKAVKNKQVYDGSEYFLLAMGPIGSKLAIDDIVSQIIK
ncbi:iron-siderophore ABC transporter substrate-binding protein [Brevibacillus brevis]|uniref:ABC transporter substrate-binding protein n=1 Tax=Brevibacillus brevis TaxID=1393 RepID=UPI0009ED5B4A|nr:iron-siderophore ABC transporter substrate-binding protein [Brevibacillus brevis]WGV57400.1 iron-siderophore ABC transporter substrate-binding protein [Brevibacillus brevis]